MNAKHDSTKPRYRNECPHCTYLGVSGLEGAQWAMFICDRHGDCEVTRFVVASPDGFDTLYSVSVASSSEASTVLGLAYAEAVRRGFIPSPDAKQVTREEFNQLKTFVQSMDRIVCGIANEASAKSKIDEQLRGISSDIAERFAAPVSPAPAQQQDPLSLTDALVYLRDVEKQVTDISTPAFNEGWCAGKFNDDRKPDESGYAAYNYRLAWKECLRQIKSNIAEVRRAIETALASPAPAEPVKETAGGETPEAMLSNVFQSHNPNGGYTDLCDLSGKRFGWTQIGTAVLTRLTAELAAAIRAYAAQQSAIDSAAVPADPTSFKGQEYDAKEIVDRLIREHGSSLVDLAHYMIDAMRDAVNCGAKGMTPKAWLG